MAALLSGSASAAHSEEERSQSFLSVVLRNDNESDLRPIETLRGREASGEIPAGSVTNILNNVLGAVICKHAGIVSLLVENGQIGEEPFWELKIILKHLVKIIIIWEKVLVPPLLQEQHFQGLLSYLLLGTFKYI
jgi:hypothetical protein